MIKKTSKISAFVAFAGILSMVVLFSACDVLEDDVTPNEPVVVIKNSDVHILADGNGYIDLYSVFETTGQITVSVTQMPAKGTLKEVATGLLKYSPFSTFKKGTDVFVLSAFNSRNELLKSDSVIIIVEDDPANLPCGLYLKDDIVYASSPSFVVDVLSNDILCGDSADLKVEIYRPDNSYPPFKGTALVSNKMITYTTSNTGKISDSLIYKVSRISDNTIMGFATVKIAIGYAVPQPCEIILNADSYGFKHPETEAMYDTLDLFVLSNDVICGTISFDVDQQPYNGTAEFQTDHQQLFVRYVYPLTDPFEEFTDSLSYKICADQKCHTALIKVNIK